MPSRARVEMLPDALSPEALRLASGNALFREPSSGLAVGNSQPQFAFFGAGGAVLGGGLVKATQQPMSFEQQLAILQATTRATSEDMKRSARLLRTRPRISLPGVTRKMMCGRDDRACEGRPERGRRDRGRSRNHSRSRSRHRSASVTPLRSPRPDSTLSSGDQGVRVADLLAGATGHISDMGLSLQQSAAVASGRTVDTPARGGHHRVAEAGHPRLRRRSPPHGAPAAADDKGSREVHGRARHQDRPHPDDRTAASAANRAVPLVALGLEPDVAPGGASANLRHGRDPRRHEGSSSCRSREYRQEISRSGQAASSPPRSPSSGPRLADLKSEAQTLGLVVGKSTAPAVELLAEDFADLIGFANKAADALGRVTGISPAPGDVGILGKKIFAVQIGGPASVNCHSSRRRCSRRLRH